jgi:hypothetical protein
MALTKPPGGCRSTSTNDRSTRIEAGHQQRYTNAQLAYHVRLTEQTLRRLRIKIGGGT